MATAFPSNRFAQANVPAANIAALAAAWNLLAGPVQDAEAAYIAGLSSIAVAAIAAFPVSGGGYPVASQPGGQQILVNAGGGGTLATGSAVGGATASALLVTDGSGNLQSGPPSSLVTGAAQAGSDGYVGTPGLGGTALTPAAANASAAVAYPESFGADPTGVADSTAALKLWMASGKNLALTPGATYQHRQQLSMTIAGQQITGNGATLKRAAQAVTTTTTAITSGVTNQITVAATSGGAGASAWSLQVGDQIVVQQGAVTNFDQSARRITSIVGNVVTISGTFGISLSGTINVYHGYCTISVLAIDCQISGVTIDGNLANWSWGRWQHTNAIIAGQGSDNLQVTGNYILNLYGDAIEPGPAPNQVIADNVISNIMGRGIVFGGFNTISPIPSDAGTRCVHNALINCNQDVNVGGSPAGDGLGSIDFSEGGIATLIAGNYISGGVDGIGTLQNPNNSECTITDNEFRNLSGYAINGSGPTSAKDIIVKGNRFKGANILLGSLTGNNLYDAWTISENHFEAASVLLHNVKNIKVIGNTFKPLQPPRGFIAVTSATGGTWSAGTYYAQITATNAAGQTVVSDEITFTLSGSQSSVTFAWLPPSTLGGTPATTGYNIYVATSSGGETGATQLLANIATPATTSYTATAGTLSTGSAPTADTSYSTTAHVGVGGNGGNVDSTEITNNIFYGGSWAVLFVNYPVTNVRVAQNIMRGQVSGGVSIGSGTTPAKIAVDQNTIVGEANAASGWNAVVVSGTNCEAKNNTVDQTLVSASSTVSFMSNNGVNPLIENNRVIGNIGKPVQFNASVTGGIVKNNIARAGVDISDASTGATKYGNHLNTGALMGTAVLSGGTITVATNEVLAEALGTLRVRLTNIQNGGTVGVPYVSAVVANTSFTITSSSGSDTSTIMWEIVH